MREWEIKPDVTRGKETSVQQPESSHPDEALPEQSAGVSPTIRPTPPQLSVNHAESPDTSPVPSESVPTPPVSPAPQQLRPETQPAPTRQTAEEALSSLIERYHNGAISREQYQRDKQLLLARINPDAVTLKRAYRAPVTPAHEPEARFVRRVSIAQAAAIAALVCIGILLIVGMMWWASPIPTSESLLRQTGSPSQIPIQ